MNIEQFYVLRHRERGPLGTYISLGSAGRAMLRVLLADPDQLEDVWVEPFELDVGEPAEPTR